MAWLGLIQGLATGLIQGLATGLIHGLARPDSGPGYGSDSGADYGSDTRADYGPDSGADYGPDQGLGILATDSRAVVRSSQGEATPLQHTAGWRISMNAVSHFYHSIALYALIFYTEIKIRLSNWVKAYEQTLSRSG